MKSLILIPALFLSLFSFASASDLKVGDPAPKFIAKTHEGKDFSLESRKGKWTVLYFYPKADTPGCTKQACAFRDSIKKIRDQGAEVYGISSDSVEAQAKFHKKHHLNFPLLADPKSKIIRQYGAKMMAVNLSKRWTFIIDPELRIRTIDKEVDPVKDAGKVTAEIIRLKAEKS